MTVEQKLDTRIKDLSSKYKDRLEQGVSKYNASVLKSTLNKVGKVDKKMEKLYDDIIQKEVPLRERAAYKLKEFAAKLKLGQMPDKIEVREVLEAKFEQLEDEAQTLRQYTSEAFSRADALKAHMALLYDERKKIKEDYEQAYDDAISLDTEITKFEDMGVSLLPYKNKGTDEEAKQLMEIGDLYDSAISVFRNGEMNYGIRENAVVLCRFYYDVVKEIANTGKQAYDDVQLMAREMRNAVINARTCTDLMNIIEKSDSMAKILGNYVGDMTKNSLGYLGIVNGVRIGNGEIIPGSVNEAIKSKYTDLGSDREQRKKELMEASKRIFRNEN